MTPRHALRISLVVSSAPLLPLVAARASAQPPHPQSQSGSAEEAAYRIPGSGFQSADGRPQREHEAFAPFRPGGGEAIDGAEDVRLPSGGTMKAQDIFEWVNGFERYLNGFGRSLREDGSDLGTVAKLRMDTTQLAKQAEELAALHLPANAGERVALDSVDALNRERGEALAAVDDLCRSLEGAARAEGKKSIERTHPWGFMQGNKGIFAVFVNTNGVGKTSLDKTRYLPGNDVCGRGAEGAEGDWGVIETDSRADATAGLYAFNFKVDAIRALAVANSDVSGAAGNAKLFVLGNQIFDRAMRDKSVFERNSGLRRDFDLTQKLNFPLGPIPMEVEYGVRGTADVAYAVKAAPGASEAKLLPRVAATAILEGGVDVVIAEGKVSGGVTLIEDTAPLSVKSGWEGLDGGGNLNVGARLDNDVSTLHGRVFTEASLMLPKASFPPWEKKEWEVDLFRWDGMKATGNIFVREEKEPVRF